MGGCTPATAPTTPATVDVAKPTSQPVDSTATTTSTPLNVVPTTAGSIVATTATAVIPEIGPAFDCEGIPRPLEQARSWNTLYYLRVVSGDVTIQSYNPASGSHALVAHVPTSLVYMSSESGLIAYRDLTRSSLVIVDAVDLITKEYPWNSDWSAILSWTRDGQIRISRYLTRIDGVGIKLGYSMVDPSSGQANNVDITLDLPSFAFSETNPREGYASVSEDGEYIVYTAKGQIGTDTVMLRLGDSQEIWRHVVDYQGTSWGPAAQGRKRERFAGHCLTIELRRLHR